ncbi:sensor/bat box HTH-10 family transcription regulator [Natronomonas pharaonis DSM 2160]|uniref:Sensor/bat box HTH-10 family transcription regulator n=1 Tax=Natronomonas pharaonis (strain ATCC 35678 / DSM 2160 / CIP 103997 / JCM 8858 / NBRC 14720 / NCIMB 2260 / Gabara) TaxID=348780 RepID=A0A1U7EYJ9_NATPD|nr:bacterio-opsin activator domain-containing protein [Natronomonas pharaonis]CAI50294.1 sensor/bat box HTH-10 family transcription regulator [Natronomonas pharaonis DSM 2160]
MAAPTLELDDSIASLLESVPDVVCILDTDARLRWWNARVPEVTGYGVGALAGRDVGELLAAESGEVARRTLADIDDHPPDHSLEVDILTRDGRQLPYEFNGGLVDIGGEQFVVTIGRNITARRNRQAAIRRQHDELDTLHRISQSVHRAISAVAEAADRAEIEQAVCDRLTASELYRAAWVGRSGPGKTMTPTAGTGSVDGLLSEVERLNALDWEGPAVVAVETGEIQVVQQIAESDFPEEVKQAADGRDIASGASVPLVHQDSVVGVLSVYSSRPTAFTDREQAALRRLGEVVGFAVTALRMRRMLLAETTTELTFRITGREAFLATISAKTGGRCEHEWSAADGDGEYRHYFTMADADPETVGEIAAETDNVTEATRVGSDGDADIFEVRFRESLVEQFFDAGAVPTAVVSEAGETTVVAELPSRENPRPLVDAADDIYGADLVSKRELDRPPRTEDEFRTAVDERLTDSQRTALRHAHLRGYFSWPREQTAEEIAEAMDRSSATFHYHIRRAQRALVEAYFRHLDT